MTCTETRPARATWFALTACAMACFAPAQQRPASLRRIAAQFEKGFLFGQSAAGADATLRLVVGAGEAEVEAPFELPNDAQYENVAGGRIFVVSGTSGYGTPSQRGFLAWVDVDAGKPPSISVAAHREYPGMDAYRIAWNRAQGLLYVVDGSDDHVEVAPWAGPPQPLPAPSSFVTAFGPGAVPTLAADFVKIWHIDGGVRIVDSFLEGYDAVFEGATWSFRPYSARTRAESPRWYSPGQRQLPAVGTLDLQALGATAPKPWSLVPLLGDGRDPVLSGIHPGDGSTVVVPCPQEFALLPGRPYRIEGSGLRAQTVTPVVTHGAGVGTAQLDVEQDLRIAAEFLCVGVEKLFGISMRVKRSVAAPAPTTLSGYLLIDVREAADRDPVIPAAGGGVTLEDPSVTAFTFDLPAGTDPFTVRWSFDVPGEAALENVVLFFQLAVVDDFGGVAYTAVHGSSILPASANPLQRQTAGARGAPTAGFRGTATDYRAWVRDAAAASRAGDPLRAARRALGQDPETGAPSPASRRLLRLLRTAMNGGG